MLRFRSVSILSVLLSVLLWTQTALAGDASNLLPRLPSTSKLVVGFNLDALRQAPVFQQALSAVSGSAQYRSAMEQIQATAPNFNPANDISTVVMSFDTVNGQNGDDMLLLVEMNLDATVLANALMEAKPAATREDTEAGYLIIDNGAALASLGNNVFAFGRIDYVRAAAAGEGSGLPRAIRSQVNSLDRSHALWAAMDAPPETASQMSMMRGSLQITSEVNASIVVTAVSEEMATELVGDFDTTRAQLAGSPEINQFGLGPIVQSIQTAASGNEMSISATIDAQTWSTLTATGLALLAAEL